MTLVFVAAAAIAVWLPARRALRIDPIVALRQESRSSATPTTSG